MPDFGSNDSIIAGLLEAPVATIENYIHYQKGRKTGEEAIKDAAVSIAKRAATGFVVGFAVTGAVALLGAGPLLITIAPILMPNRSKIPGYMDLPLHPT